MRSRSASPSSFDPQTTTTTPSGLKAIAHRPHPGPAKAAEIAARVPNGDAQGHFTPESGQGSGAPLAIFERPWDTHTVNRLRFVLCLSLLWACAEGGNTTTDSGTVPGSDAQVAPGVDGGTGPSCGPGTTACGDVCVSLDVDPSHCGACDNACSDGERCSGGMCEVTCPAGQQACTVGSGTQCVSTQSDREHCGACGNTCGAAQVCSEGTCTSSCAAGLESCTVPGGGVECADLDDSTSHCGACNMACAPGQSCTDGTCTLVCPSGQTACGGLCVDLDEDEANCGACANMCPADQRCNSGTCELECTGGTTECDGACRDLTADANNCGSCGNACDPGQVCQAGTCTLSCPGSQTVCAGECRTTATDVDHCGACGNVCPAPSGGTASCVAGSCQRNCPSGQTECTGTCRDLNTDGSHCGSCGNVCGAGQVCMGGTCETTIPTFAGPTFQVNSFSSSGCSLIDHAMVTGDDRGGIAVSTSQLFYTGDSGTGRFSRSDLSGGTAITAQLDTMVTDVATSTVYLLGSADGPFGQGGGTVTHLYPLTPEGQLDGEGISLSMAVPATGTAFGSQVGLFSGHGRVVVHNGSRVFSIATPSGVVTDLGAMSTPARRTCENWAYWGIAETDGSNTNLIFVASETSILRQRVGASTSSSVGSFTDLSDMCSIVASPSNNRWYFHHEYDSQFGGSGTITDEHFGYCSATYDTSGGNFRVTALNTTGCNVLEHGTETGDDRGGIGISTSYVFYTGDTATARAWRSLSSATRLGQNNDAMVSNTRTGDVYFLGNAGIALARGGGTITQLIPVSATSGRASGTPINLSTAIDASGSTSAGRIGIFAGYDRIGIYNGTRAYHIALPSGEVTDLGPVTLPNVQTCENWAFWGIAEYFDDRMHFVYADTNDDLVRVRVPEGTQSVVSAFTNLSDMCSVTVAPSLNRWYFHHEYTSQLTSNSGENIGYCSLSWTQP